MSGVMNTTTSKAAAALGKLGGSVRSEAKTAAARQNGKRGGRPASLLRSRALDRFPGDTAREMTAPATDRAGVTWEAGTIYQPLSAGNAGGFRYHDVRIQRQGRASVETTFEG
jgi:hypothetical protein